MKRMLVAAVILSLGVVASVQTAPRTITVTNVIVRIGRAAYYSAYGARWSFPVTLEAGQDVILGGSRPGGFTTSYATVLATGPGLPYADITVDGVTTRFTDLGGVLNVQGTASNNSVDNKAQNWSLPLHGDGYAVQFGYADTIHASELCDVRECVPTGFLAPTVRQHAPSPYPVGFGYDSGVIRILATE